jgi:hypothetical protein
MNVSASLCGPGDHIWLPHKLRVMSGMADRIVILADRCPEADAICKRFRKCELRHVESRPEDIGQAKDGPRWSEGANRQILWDWATDCQPEWVILTDMDETPSPDLAWMLVDGCDDIDVWYADWVNLLHDASRAIGGLSAWSYQVPTNNKKGLLARWRPNTRYRYQQLTRHVRMEPNPVHGSATIHDDMHRLGGPKLIHYRWANWPRWSASPESQLPYYQPWPPKDATVVNVPRSWLHLWDGDDLIDSLPERIAVVGNGPMVGMGEEIDGHPCVIRFNNWRTTGYEPHVGSKTDIWCTNVHEDVAYRPDWCGEVLSVTTDGEQYARTGKWLGMYPQMHTARRSWTDDTRRIKPSNPSTGLVLLHRLAQTGKQIDAYGFKGMSGGHYFNPAHEHLNHGSESAALSQLSGRINFR